MLEAAGKHHLSSAFFQERWLRRAWRRPGAEAARAQRLEARHPGGAQEVTYTVPADKCGLVIGKGKRCCTAQPEGRQAACPVPPKHEVAFLPLTKGARSKLLPSRHHCLGLLVNGGRASTSSPSGNRCCIRGDQLPAEAAWVVGKAQVRGPLTVCQWTDWGLTHLQGTWRNHSDHFFQERDCFLTSASLFALLDLGLVCR